VISQSVLSTEYIGVAITASDVSGATDLDEDVVEFAFMKVVGAGSGSPGSGDWHPGDWSIQAPGIYVARCLVGPANGGIALDGVGTYAIWIRIGDSPEVPVDRVGLLQLT
jgi:hypothetical protein